MFTSSLPPKVLVASCNIDSIQKFTTLQSDISFELVDVVSKFSEIITLLKCSLSNFLLIDDSLAIHLGKTFFDSLLANHIKTNVIVSTHNHLLVRQLLYSDYFDGSIIQQGVGKYEFMMCLKAIFEGRRVFFSYVDKSCVSPSPLPISTNDSSSLNVNISCLSEREKEVWSLLLKSYSEFEIADELFISVQTVRKHKSNMAEKLNIKHKKR
jgi:DNA-binding NarL/FixJ family response regulator